MSAYIKWLAEYHNAKTPQDAKHALDVLRRIYGKAKRKENR